MPAAGQTPLLERDEPLAALGAALDDVLRTQRGRLVLIRGEAGIGKTALVERFCADQSDARVLRGTCASLTTPAPLGPILEIAGALGGELERTLPGEPTAYEAAAALITDLGTAPTLLVIEDLHWADEATLDVLRLLARRIRHAATLVLGTYRDDELPRRHPLTSVLGECASNPSVDRLALPPLSRKAVAELACESNQDAAALHRITGGNPFFVAEVLAGGTQQIPETVRDAVLARVDRLDPSAQGVLELIALVPPKAELWLVEREGSLADLDACLEVGLVVARGDGVAFRHELARRAVEESLAPGRRLELHRVVLGGLMEVDGDLARLAHHAEGAGDAELVLRYAPAAAARAAAVGAHREGAAQYARALRFASSLDADARASLCLGHSVECYLVGDDEAGIASIDAAVAVCRTGDDAARLGAVLRLRALTLVNWGFGTEAEETAHEARLILETLPSGDELTMTYALLASIAVLDERTAEGEEWSERASELAAEVGGVEARVAALAGLGLARAFEGREEGLEQLETALRRAREARLENQIGKTYLFMTMAASRQRSLERARHSTEAGLEYCVERGLTAWEDVLLATRAWVELEIGEWETASWTVTQVLARNCTLSSVQAKLVLGLLRARRGDPDARAPLEDAAPVVERTSQLWWIGLLAAARAEAAWLEGRTEAIREVTDEAFALALERRASWPVAELGYWRRLAGIEEELPDYARGPFAAQARGDWAGAADEWARAGCRYNAAVALSQGDEDAQRRALAELKALGARPAARMVARRLRERGARDISTGPRASTQANPAGLTARELEVLVLLAEGLRNADIAARLVVSPRTVDHHVSAILRKLDARTRSEAAAAGARLGLVTIGALAGTT